MSEAKEQKLEHAQGSAEAPLVIGIGASAGGLEALQQFFGHMPTNSGLSFVVVQHLSPDYKSLMADILGKHTGMPVHQAEHEMAVEPDTVYLIPPKKYMTIQGGRLILSDYAPGTLNHPIDAFFASLAEERREHSIVVVLSGTGSDGTNGVKAVKEHGGLVIAQDPESAKFGGMPKSVINTGLADFILSPEEIADEILNFSTTPVLLRTPQNDALSEEDMLFSEEETLSHIYTILKNASGIDFTYYKRSTILRRIERRMLVTHSAIWRSSPTCWGTAPMRSTSSSRRSSSGSPTSSGIPPSLRSSSTTPSTRSWSGPRRTSPSGCGAPAAPPARRPTPSLSCSGRPWRSCRSSGM